MAKSGLESIRPETLLAETFNYNPILKQLRLNNQKHDLDDFDRIFLFGIGAGSSVAVEYLQSVLGNLPLIPFVIDYSAQESKKLWSQTATKHPTSINAEATSKFLSYGPFSEFDLVIALTDGSANGIINAGSITPPDMQKKILQGLSDLGAGHNEILTVMVHLAEGRGGDLATKLFPAKIINFVVSNTLDEVGNPVISSPFASHPSTHYDAKMIVEKYNVLVKCNLNSCEFVSVEHNVISGQTTQHKTEIILLASPLTWLEPIKLSAKEFGLLPQVYSLNRFGVSERQEWLSEQAEHHSSVAVFPELEEIAYLNSSENGSGSELYLSSGIYGEPAGILLSSDNFGKFQDVVVESPTFDVGALAIKLS